MMNNFDTLDYQETIAPAEEELRPSTIEVHDGDQIIAIPHPVIADETLLSSTEPIPERKMVNVIFSAGVECDMPFADYLLLLGFSSYARYTSFCEDFPDGDQASILRDIQRNIIEGRLLTTRKRHEKFKYESNNADYQEQSTREHSFMWNKAINDLGLPGITAESANKVFDYLNAIDEFIILDLAELNDEEQALPTRIGVQRSFDDKSRKIQEDPIAYIPELASQGPIFRVFIRDSRENYSAYQSMVDSRDKKIQQEAESKQQTIVEYVEAEAQAKGISSREYLAQRLRRLPLHKFLQDGMLGQLRWAESIVSQTMYQLETYIPLTRDWQRDSLRNSIDGLKKILVMIEEEKIAAQ